MAETDDPAELLITLGDSTEVPYGSFVQMLPSEAGMVIARALLEARNLDWSVPNMRAHAEASLRTRARQATGGRGGPDKADLLKLAQALSDGFGWLISRGLVGPASQNSGATGEYRLTSAGREMAATADAGPAEAAFRLHADLHPALDEARLLFERGSYQTAVFAATHQVEVHARDLSGAGPETYGVQLMRDSFHPERGPLATGEIKSEREAIMALFAGTIGAFKNPTSHRAVKFDDPTEAADIIHLADLLLRIAARSAAANAAAGGPGPMSADDTDGQ